MAKRSTAIRHAAFASWRAGFCSSLSRSAAIRAATVGCALVPALCAAPPANAEPMVGVAGPASRMGSIANTETSSFERNSARHGSRLSAKDLGLVINTADPYSVEVGEFYIRARKLAPEQILRVAVPVKPALTPDEFQALRSAIDARFSGATQALALAWTMPYAVSCNSITGALALGYEPFLCVDPQSSCAPSKASPYFNSRSHTPYSSFGMRLSMLLAANDAAQAKTMISRGVAADHSLGLRGAPPSNALFVITQDKARSSRAPLFPPTGKLRESGITVHTQNAQSVGPVDRLVIYETGAMQVPNLDALHWLPGALADHLTSFGGQLDGKSGQMTALEWIASGATASYGTVSEPCSHQQKFPHPQVLLYHYAQGATAIEAYWRSVAWPLQGLFIGEPLAAPFARR